MISGVYQVPELKFDAVAFWSLIANKANELKVLG
jgi:hypothetical protein